MRTPDKNTTEKETSNRSKRNFSVCQAEQHQRNVFSCERIMNKEHKKSLFKIMTENERNHSESVRKSFKTLSRGGRCFSEMNFTLKILLFGCLFTFPIHVLSFFYFRTLFVAVSQSFPKQDVLHPQKVEDLVCCDEWIVVGVVVELCIACLLL